MLHNIGQRQPNWPAEVRANYNTDREIFSCREWLSFDGVYRSVYRFPFCWIGKQPAPVLFVIGRYVGMDNSFDVGMPREQFCTWPELFELQDMGAELGWHSETHCDLTTLPPAELEQEVRQPFPMRYFAYPHGRFNEEVIAAVQDAGYEDAFSVTQGGGERWQRRRKYLCPARA